ncbi:DUF427 domain-containing protein [Streptomyces chartreusis]|uniref:DUF427 domain-containing protein n=1 Tax=Streptomyces chartreusis TaxID=1969 RepID=UPI002101C5DA|nr:DUF427 domain-containing protein [Streptomyces chartreusis]
MLLHEPGRYPVAYFLLTDVAAGVLEQAEHTTHHRDLGAMSWYSVRAGGQSKQRAAWQHVDLPDYAEGLKERVASPGGRWDGFFEEYERIVGHAADTYRRMGIRSTNRHLVVRNSDQVVAEQAPSGPVRVRMQLLRHRAAWSYEDAWDEVRRSSGMVSFEPDEIEVSLGGVRPRLEPGQSVVSHGVGRNLDLDGARGRGSEHG